MNPFWRSYFSDGLVQPPTSAQDQLPRWREHARRTERAHVLGMLSCTGAPNPKKLNGVDGKTRGRQLKFLRKTPTKVKFRYLNTSIYIWFINCILYIYAKMLSLKLADSLVYVVQYVYRNDIFKCLKPFPHPEFAWKRLVGCILEMKGFERFQVGGCGQQRPAKPM